MNVKCRIQVFDNQVKVLNFSYLDKKTGMCKTSEFIQKAKARFGEMYDYKKVEYVNSKTKVVIICPIHGEFEQVPYEHLRSSPNDCGCRTRNSFVDREAGIKKCTVCSQIKQIGEFVQYTIKSGRKRIANECKVCKAKRDEEKQIKT